MGRSLAITGCGMVTGIGLSAPATCAAIRCALSNVQETRFTDSLGEPILGSAVPLPEPAWSRAKLIKMAAAAIDECLRGRPDVSPGATPLLLCLAETDRPGRLFQDDDQLFADLSDELGLRFHPQSRVVAEGRVSVAVAMQEAQRRIYDDRVQHVLVAATDSLLVSDTLSEYEEAERLLTATNSNGFIPGEAAGALLLESGETHEGSVLCCEGLGFGMESATVMSEEPLKAEGQADAIRESLANAEMDESALEFRIIDVSGEQYYFKEASLAFSRVCRAPRVDLFDIWHPADCVGEVGAASGAVMVGVLKAACEKNYSKGSVILANLGNDDGKRSSLIFAWKEA